MLVFWVTKKSPAPVSCIWKKTLLLNAGGGISKNHVSAAKKQICLNFQLQGEWWYTVTSGFLENPWPPFFCRLVDEFHFTIFSVGVYHRPKGTTIFQMILDFHWFTWGSMYGLFAYIKWNMATFREKLEVYSKYSLHGASGFIVI